MMNKDTFADWLEIHTDLKQYAIKRYSRAIDTLSLELGDFGLQRMNLFNLTYTDTAFIDTILNNPEFKNNLIDKALETFTIG